jgi:type 1 glutamine amidotransferase
MSKNTPSLSAAIVLCLFMTTTCLVTGTVHAESPLKVLIIDGYSNHDWQRNTKLIRQVLDHSGICLVEVATAPNTPDALEWSSWRPTFSKYDVLIQTCNDLPGGSNPKTLGPQWPSEVQSDFVNYVRDGGGVFIYHGGNNAFASWPAYNEIIGLGWRPADFGTAISLDKDGQLTKHQAGTGEKTGHGPRANTLIHRRGDHPIHRGLPSSWMAAELEVYFYARGPAKNLDVLSYGFDQKTQMYWPTEWTVEYGKVRAYSSTYGHVWKDQVDPPNMNDVAFQTILPRALQWLAHREVTYAIPDDFPGTETPSLRTGETQK